MVMGAPQPVLRALAMEGRFVGVVLGSTYASAFICPPAPPVPRLLPSPPSRPPPPPLPPVSVFAALLIRPPLPMPLPLLLSPEPVQRGEGGVGHSSRVAVGPAGHRSSAMTQIKTEEDNAVRFQIGWYKRWHLGVLMTSWQPLSITDIPVAVSDGSHSNPLTMHSHSKVGYASTWGKADPW
jgi:hypothetical protein